MPDILATPIINLRVSGARGKRGFASGPLGASSVAAEEISDNGADQVAIREKIGAASDADLGVVEAQASETAANLPKSSTAFSDFATPLRPVLRLNSAMRAAALSETLRFAIVFDSTGEPAGIAYPNSVAENWQRILETLLPGRKIEVANFSLPGRTIADLADPAYTAPADFSVVASGRSLNTSYWPGGSTSGKSWQDHIKDYGPDGILFSMQLNGFEDSVPFQIYYNDPNPAQGIYTCSQSWTKKPLWINVTALIPEGTAAYQRHIQELNDFLRYTSFAQGLGLVDAEAPYRLTRAGRRRELMRWYAETDFAGYADDDLWSVNPSLSLAGTTVSGTGISTRLVTARDFDVSYEVTRTNTGTIFILTGRTRDPQGGYSVQVNFADRRARLVFRGDYVAIGDQFAAVPVGDSAFVRWKADRDQHKVWVNDVLVNVYRSPVGMAPGPIGVGFDEASGAATEANIAWVEEAQVAPSFFDADVMLNDDFHHPSEEGSFRSYIPALKQFADEFVAALRRPLVHTRGRLTTSPTFPESGTLVMDESALSFTVSSDQTIPVRITFGYKNPFTASATLTLRLDGVGVFGWPLPPTSGSDNRQVSFFAEVPVTAGNRTLDLVFTAAPGTTAGNGVTSAGAYNDRELAATIVPV